MPKIGPNNFIIKKIRTVLSQNPEGIWVRKISRVTQIPFSTVLFYLKNHMSKEVEVVKTPLHIYKLFKLKDSENLPTSQEAPSPRKLGGEA